MLTMALLSTMTAQRALISLRAARVIQFLQDRQHDYEVDRMVADSLTEAANRVHLGHPQGASDAAVEVERIEGVCILLFDAGTEWRIVDNLGHPVGPWTSTKPDAESLRTASILRAMPCGITQRVVA